MNASLAMYSTEEFERAFQEIYKRLISSPRLTMNFRPKAYLLGGQSGAGKTALHKILYKELNGNVVVINGDEYRSHHPRYKELYEAFGAESVNYTQAWSGKMTEALVDELSRLGYNLIIEGTLRTSEVPLKSAKLLRSRGYGVSLAFMAVKPEISLLSCQIRYEQMRLEGTIPRATNPEHHNMIVTQIVDNLRILEESGVFDEVLLYTRAKKCIYPIPDEKQSASDVLKEALFGKWSQEEKEHAEMLREKLKKLREK